jgi:hypothetical protein
MAVDKKALRIEKRKAKMNTILEIISDNNKVLRDAKRTTGVIGADNLKQVRETLSKQGFKDLETIITLMLAAHEVGGI